MMFEAMHPELAIMNGEDDNSDRKNSDNSKSCGGDRTYSASIGKEKNTKSAYIKYIEIAVALAVECAIDGGRRSTEYHRVRWEELLKSKGIQPPKKDAFRAFRRGLPPNLKEKNPSEEK